MGTGSDSIYRDSGRRVIYICLCPETVSEVEFKINGLVGPKEHIIQIAALLFLAVFSKTDSKHCEQKQRGGF